VLWRRMSHGTASAVGSRFVASILSVVETCKGHEALRGYAPQPLAQSCKLPSSERSAKGTGGTR
jgi:hypothetical protein